MGVGYQFSDRHAIDYQLWYPKSPKIPLRGPKRIDEATTRYWSFAGAAQTFGRFVEQPFPELVSNFFGMPCLNLGFAGAGPEFFLNRPGLIELINKSELCHLQLMSGRSVTTDILRQVADGGKLEFQSGPLKGQRFLAAAAYRKLLERYGTRALEDQVGKVRARWKEAYATLLDRIRVPVVGVWISQRTQEQDAPGGDEGDVGDFPHFIGVDEIRYLKGRGIQIVGAALTQPPQQLILNYVTRRPVAVYPSDDFPFRPDWSRVFNTYYPTPEMHVAVANVLCRHLLVSRPNIAAR